MQNGGSAILVAGLLPHDGSLAACPADAQFAARQQPLVERRTEEILSVRPQLFRSVLNFRTVLAAAWFIAAKASALMTRNTENQCAALDRGKVPFRDKAHIDCDAQELIAAALMYFLSSSVFQSAPLPVNLLTSIESKSLSARSHAKTSLAMQP